MFINTNLVLQRAEVIENKYSEQTNTVLRFEERREEN